MSVMPFLVQTAFTCAPPSPPSALSTVPFELRRLRGVHVQRNAVLARRQDAARVQHLRAAGGDLLGLVVVQRAQQPRGGRGARVGAEHAGHVGPDLQPLRRAAWRRDTPRRCPSRRGPRSTVLPSSSLAMKPWVMTSAAAGREARLRARASGAKLHSADSTLALGERAATLRAQHGARVDPGDRQTARGAGSALRARWPSAHRSP